MKNKKLYVDKLNDFAVHVNENGLKWLDRHRPNYFVPIVKEVE